MAAQQQQQQQTPSFRPVIIDGLNVGLYGSHDVSKKWHRFDVRLIEQCVMIVLKYYLKDMDEYLSQHKQNSTVKLCQCLLRQLIKTLSGLNISNWNPWDILSDIWDWCDFLPPVYIIYEVESLEEMYKKENPQVRPAFKQRIEKFNRFIEYKFISPLPVPPGTYGDYLLIDFAATYDAIVISRDNFNDLESDPLVSVVEGIILREHLQKFELSNHQLTLIKYNNGADKIDGNLLIDNKGTATTADIQGEQVDSRLPSADDARRRVLQRLNSDPKLELDIVKIVIDKLNHLSQTQLKRQLSEIIATLPSE